MLRVPQAAQDRMEPPDQQVFKVQRAPLEQLVLLVLQATQDQTVLPALLEPLV